MDGCEDSGLTGLTREREEVLHRGLERSDRGAQKEEAGGEGRSGPPLGSAGDR